ncbi:MAG: hypothetical protein KAH20_01375 [Methylococcales bacterium]|nr:hypothetical protein [Methylococcales bacterium]
MREIKSGLVNTSKQNKIIVLQNIPQHHGLVKANRFLLLLASSLMVIVFILGFLLIPTDDVLEDFKSNQKLGSTGGYNTENPVLSAEIKTLKGQFVGLISGSIESKLRILEDSVRKGSINASLGAIQDLRIDVKVLQSYSAPVVGKNKSKNQTNDEILKEVSQLKSLIYLTLGSCGLMIAAVCGFWFRKRYQLSHPNSSNRAGLTKEE